MAKTPATTSIAILGTRGIPARYGGFETFAEHVSVGLAARGWQVTVYCEADGTDRPVEYKSVRLVTLPARGIGPLRTILFDLACLWHARRADVSYMLGYGASLFCWIPRLAGHRVWINMDGIEWQRSKFNWLGRAYLRLMEAVATRAASRLIADAQGIKQHLLSRYRRLPPVTVIPYGGPVVTEADAAPLASWSLTPGHYDLIVARLEPENHVLEAIQGFKARQRPHPLIVVGDNKVDTPYVRRLNAEACDSVRFVGGVYDPNRLLALRYHCRAYIHGHSVGGTNPSLLEAMGCGNLVIAHDNVFNREVTRGNAYFFKTPADLDVILSALDQSPDDAASFRHNVRDIVATIYTWQNIVDAYEALLMAE